MAPTERPSRSAWLGWSAWGLLMFGVALAWWVPDLPATLRAWWRPVAQMSAGCDLAQGPCAARFADGGEVTLTVDPPHAPTNAPVTLTVREDGVGVPTGLAVLGVDMYMGLITLPLIADADAYVAQARLPLCTLDRMRWRVDVLFEDRTAVFHVVSVDP